MKRYLPNVKHPRLILAGVVCCAFIAAGIISIHNARRHAGDRLIAAIEAGDAEAVKQELRGWADVNEAREVVDVWIDGREFRESWSNVTPLYRVAGTSRVYIAEVLLDAGAELDAVIEPAGWTPLHRAAMFGDDSMIRLLISRGADISAVDHLGRTPLECAESRRRRLAFDTWKHLGQCVLQSEATKRFATGAEQ